jgi:hypothetical protein
MQPFRNPGRVALFVGAVVLSLQTSPIRAGGGHGHGGDNRHGRVEVTFTKWVLGLGPNPTFMLGITGGDAEGTFVGELFPFTQAVSANPSLLQPVSRNEVIYEVQANDPSRSFTALLRGGSALGHAQLDGRVLAGWRIGSEVHVEWDRLTGPVNCPSPPAGAGPNCFVGTITIERAGHDDDDD